MPDQIFTYWLQPGNIAGRSGRPEGAGKHGMMIAEPSPLWVRYHETPFSILDGPGRKFCL